MERYVHIVGGPDEDFQRDVVESVFIYPADAGEAGEGDIRVPQWVADAMDSGDRSDPRLETEGVAFVWDERDGRYNARGIKMDDSGSEDDDDACYGDDDPVMSWLEILEADDRHPEED